MRRVPFAAAVGLMLALAACGPKTVPVPVVTQPRFPEFLKPAVASAQTASAPALAFERGWAFLQDADFKNAEREFSAALRADGAFSAANTGFGYLEIARKDAKASLPHFDRALEKQPRDVPALVGRGEALEALGRDADALTSFEAATVVDPSLVDVKRRVEVLRFRAVEQNVTSARDLARTGKNDEAIRAYAAALASSPDSPFLYRELAVVQRRAGDTAGALTNFRKATALDPSDAASLEQTGELLEAAGDLEGAVASYDASLGVERSEAVTAKRDAVRVQMALARLPAEYRAIEQAPEVTRADLAALVALQLEPLLRAMPRRDPGVITDLRGHWAETWILDVARAGAMDPYENHTFQPRTLVRRVDLAQVVNRLLPRAAALGGVPAAPWQSARLSFSDLTTTNLAYLAASASVASGILETGPQNSFQPSRAVSGQEAVDAVRRLARMGKLSPARGVPAR